MPAATVADVDRHVRVSELLVGVEGLALLRHLYDGTDDAARRRLAEIRRILDDERLDDAAAIRETDARSGYREWSHTYDEPGNQIVALEQPEVWSLIEPLAPGRALDAACGTGRHAARLAALGHSVVGVDLTPRDGRTGVRQRPGGGIRCTATCCAIPAADQEFDLVVCGLALSHLPDLDAAVGELAASCARGA